MSLHGPILEIARFYARHLEDADALRIVDAGVVRDEAEARHLLEFCENMVDTAVRLREERELVHGEPVNMYDVEKTYLTLHDVISGGGFDHLIE
jgi:hypothetical protein